LLREAKALRDRARVHFHCYTSETIAEVHLFGGKQLTPGESGFAQLRLAQPALLVPGDRFIIRQFSPVVTVGGGVVLDNAPDRKANKSREDLLRVLASRDIPSMLRMRIARRANQ